MTRRREASVGAARSRKGRPSRWTSTSSEFSIATTFTSSVSWSTRSRKKCTSVAPNRIARLDVSDSGNSASGPLPAGKAGVCAKKAARSRAR